MEESFDSLIEKFKQATAAFCKLTEDTPVEIVKAITDLMRERSWSVEYRVMRERKYPGQE